MNAKALIEGGKDIARVEGRGGEGQLPVTPPHLVPSLLHQVRNRDWRAARVRSDDLNFFIVNASGTATLEDVRR